MVDKAGHIKNMRIMGYEVKKDTLVQPVTELKGKLSTPKSQSSTLSELVFSRSSYLPLDETAADLHAASTPVRLTFREG